MRKILQKEAVAKALADLTAQKGKKPTYTTLHAALGNRGSMSTLIRLVGEIEAAQKPVTEAGEAFRTYLEVWELAMDEGRKQAEAQIKDLTQIHTTLAQENDRLDGQVNAANDRLETLDKEKSALQAELVQTKADLEKRLNEAQAALIECGNQTRLALEKASQAQTAHATELAALRAERDKAIEKQHAAEIELTACKSRQEAKR